MSEVEASIKEIAQYVKNVTQDIKSNALTRAEFERELELIRGQFHSAKPQEHLFSREPTPSSHDNSQLERRMDEIEKKINTLAAKRALSRGDAVDIHIKRLEELEEKFDNLSKSVSKSSAGLVLSKVRDDILKKMQEEAAAVRAELNARMDTAEIKINDVKNTHHEGMENHTDDLRKQVEQLRSEFKDTLETKDLKEYRSMVEDVRDMRKSVEEEIALRVSLDKRMHELGEQVRRAPQAAPARIEASKEIGDKIEREATYVVTKHLNEFAKTLDKKIPELATKDELAKLEIRNKPAEMLDKRLDILEQRMNELLSLLRAYNRSDRHFVVE